MVIFNVCSRFNSVNNNKCLLKTKRLVYDYSYSEGHLC